MLTELNYFGARLAPLLWVAAAFGIYLAVALLVTIISDSATAGSAAGYLVIFAAVLLWRRTQSAWVALPTTNTQRLDRRSFWMLVIGTLALCWFTGQVAASWVMQTLGSEQYEQRIAAQAETPLLLVMISAIVLAPMGEEALMRGVAYPMVRKIFSPVAAAAITAVVFALIHGNLVQIMVAIPLGMLLAFVYERTQRLWTVIVLHAFFNAAAMMTPAALISELATVPVIAAGLAATFVALWLVRPSAGRLVEGA